MSKEENKNPVIISKKELAEKLQITTRLLAIWFNELYFEELKAKTNYNKYSKIVKREHLNIVFPDGIN